LLTVAAYETAAYLTVKAEASDKSNGTALVTVTGDIIEMGDINLPFSGNYSETAPSDSVIDLIKENADHKNLSLILENTDSPENLSFGNNDLSTTGLKLKHTDMEKTSPALVTIDGGGRNIKLTPQAITPFITVGDGVKLTLKNIAFDCADDNNTVYHNFQFIKVESGGYLIMETGAYIRGFKTNGNGGGVYVDSGGNFTMSGGEISGNTGYYGGGVYVKVGTFTMSGGTISDNTALSNGNGGGVYVNGGTFTMSDGTISGNTANSYGGGGVYVKGGTFTMSKGTISGNTSSQGGGVSVTQTSTFTMSGGTISYNTASGNGSGGGVFVANTSTFTMSGGIISGNTAYAKTTFGVGKGGGVCTGGTFKKTGGSIYGSDVSDDETGDKLENTATKDGHAAYVLDGSKIRTNTAHPEDNLDSEKAGEAGGWK
jgi:hypothetical protein